jgi:hypothetical protein
LWTRPGPDDDDAKQQPKLIFFLQFTGKESNQFVVVENQKKGKLDGLFFYFSALSISKKWVILLRLTMSSF